MAPCQQRIWQPSVTSVTVQLWWLILWHQITAFVELFFWNSVANVASYHIYLLLVWPVIIYIYICKIQSWQLRKFNCEFNSMRPVSDISVRSANCPPTQPSMFTCLCILCGSYYYKSSRISYANWIGLNKINLWDYMVLFPGIILGLTGDNLEFWATVPANLVKHGHKS